MLVAPANDVYITAEKMAFIYMRLRCKNILHNAQRRFLLFQAGQCLKLPLLEL